MAAFADARGDRPLHMLINNAGIMACPLAYTADDLEMQVGTNHFGHFLLSLGLARSLMNAAEEGQGSRVVSVSSGGHRRSPVHFDDPNYRHRPYDKWEAYGQSKTANCAVRGRPSTSGSRTWGVTANAVMPGAILTPLQRHLPREEMVALAVGSTRRASRSPRVSKTPRAGASSTSVWAATGEELEGIGGLYLENLAQAEIAKPGDRTGVMAYALDPEAAERLWLLSEETTGVSL